VSEGGLEHTFEGNFPSSVKFPWVEHNRPTPAGARHFTFRPASRAGRRAMSGAGPPRAAFRCSPAVTICAARRVRAGEISAVLNASGEGGSAQGAAVYLVVLRRTTVELRTNS
jgi:hypothetical protein